MAINFPDNPTIGQLFVAPNGVRYVYSTKGWSSNRSPSSLYGANPGNNPPTGAPIGTIWMDTDTNILYVYKAENGSASWVAVTGAAGSSTAAAGISLEGVAYYDGNIETDVGINLELQPES